MCKVSSGHTSQSGKIGDRTTRRLLGPKGPKVSKGQTCEQTGQIGADTLRKCRGSARQAFLLLEELCENTECSGAYLNKWNVSWYPSGQ